MIVNNPTAQYCHSALKPTYTTTPLTTPTVTMTPSDCPNVTINWNLVQPLSSDAPFDPALIKNVTSAFSVDTQSPAMFGQKTYSWIATAVTNAFIIGTTARTDFNIYVQGCTSTGMSPSSAGPGAFNYLIDGSNQTFTLPSYTYTSSACANPYAINVVRTDTNTTVPFTWVNNSTTIWFKSADSMQTGVTNYKIEAA